MKSNKMLILRGVGAVAIVAALFLILSDGDDKDGDSEQQAGTPVRTSQPDESSKPEKEPRRPKPRIPVIEVVNGEPVGGLAELDFQSGDRVRFRVDSDVADEVHVHGYDILRDVAAGRQRQLRLPSRSRGRLRGRGRATRHASG